MADIKVNNLRQETLSTLDGSEQLVGFDTVEGLRLTINALTEFMAKTKGITTYKEVTMSSTDADSTYSGYTRKKQLSWTGMTDKDWVEAAIISGTYNKPFMIESVTDKVNIYFSVAPPTNLKLRIYRLRTTLGG